MDSDVTKDLKDISFRALPGQLTAVLAIDQAERRYSRGGFSHTAAAFSPILFNLLLVVYPSIHPSIRT